MIPDFKTYIGESVWNDIRKRGNGSETKVEDDVNHMDFDTFADYIEDNYSEKGNWFAIRESEDGKSRSIEIDIIYGKEIDLSFNVVEGEIYNILVNGNKNYVDIPGLKQIFNVNIIGSSTFCVYEKNWTISNNTFVKLIEFFLDKKTTNESVWNDIRKRGLGTDVKKEDDIDLLDIDGLYDYIDTHYKQSAKGDAFGRKQVKVNDETLSVPVLMDYSGRDLPQTLYLSIKCLNTETYISISPALKDWAPDLYNFLKYHFTLEDVINKQGNVISSHYIKIKPKDGSGVTNTFFISLIDFLLERVKDRRICKLIERI